MIEPGPATWNATEEPPSAGAAAADHRPGGRARAPAPRRALAIAGVFDSNGGTSTVDTEPSRAPPSPPPSTRPRRPSGIVERHGRAHDRRRDPRGRPRACAARFPSAARSPLKALDDKAMDLASQDAELRAALFRFVDVVPACRSLDDLARHLTGFLDEVDDRPPPLDVAMRMARHAGRAAPRSAPPPRPACGTWRTASSSARRRRTPTRIAARAVARRRRDVGRPARRGDGHRRRGRPLRGSAAPRRSTTLAARLRAAARRARSSSATRAGPLPRANLSVKVSALTPLLRPDAPELGKRDAAPRLRALLRRAHATSARTCTSTWSRSTRARRSLDLVLELLAEDEFARRPVGRASCCRPTCATRPTLLDRIARLGARDAARARRSSSGSSRAPTGTTRSSRRASTAGSAPVFEVKADCDRNFEALTRALLEARPLVRVGDRLAQPALGRPRDRRTTARSAATTRDLELQVLRGLGDDLAARARRARACACAPTARSATSSPAWPTSCAACSRTPATSRFLARAGARACRSRSCWPRREPAAVRQRAAARAAPRARARGAARRRCASSTPRAAAARAGAGSATSAATATRSSRPTRATPTASSPLRRVGDAGRRRRARSRRAERRVPGVGARRRPRERARALVARRGAGCASAGRELAALAVRECAKPWAEADADVCEAIDFLEYYARGAIALERGRAAAPGPRRAQRDALRAARRRAP